MLQELAQKIEPALLPANGSEVFLGVSGGGDSTLLLLMIAGLASERDWSLRVLHFRHGNDGSDDAAEKRVRALAEESKAEFRLGKIEEYEARRRPKDSEQMALRRMRYGFFAKHLGASEGPSALLLGHSADDQAETVLMRALKGRWLEGLAGIPAAREFPEGDSMIYRPLMRIPRAEIQATLKAMERDFEDDPANRDKAYLRVNARNGLLASAKEMVGEEVLSSLSGLAQQANDLDQAMAWMLPFLQERTELKIEEGEFVFALDVELPAYLWRVLLRWCLLELGLNSREATLARVERLRLVEETRGAQELGEGVLYRRVGTQLRLWRKEQNHA